MKIGGREITLNYYLKTGGVGDFDCDNFYGAIAETLFVSTMTDLRYIVKDKRSFNRYREHDIDYTLLGPAPDGVRDWEVKQSIKTWRTGNIIVETKSHGANGWLLKSYAYYFAFVSYEKIHVVGRKDLLKVYKKGRFLDYLGGSEESEGYLLSINYLKYSCPSYREIEIPKRYRVDEELRDLIIDRKKLTV